MSDDLARVIRDAMPMLWQNGEHEAAAAVRAYYADLGELSAPALEKIPELLDGHRAVIRRVAHPSDYETVCRCGEPFPCTSVLAVRDFVATAVATAVAPLVAERERLIAASVRAWRNRAEAAEARVAPLVAERERLREYVGLCRTHWENGPDASVTDNAGCVLCQWSRAEAAEAEVAALRATVERDAGEAVTVSDLTAGDYVRAIYRDGVTIEGTLVDRQALTFPEPGPVVRCVDGTAHVRLLTVHRLRAALESQAGEDRG